MPLLTADEQLATRARSWISFGCIVGNHELVQANAAFVTGLVALVAPPPCRTCSWPPSA
jgi:hypothetical protein